MIGLAVGAVVVPLTLSLAHESSLALFPEAGKGGLGSEDLPCPQASFFATVLSALFLDGVIPWGPVGVGAALGVLAVVLEELGRVRSALLSSLALAVGIYLPADIGCGIMLGAMARFLATRQVSSSTHAGILNAAGLITGYAFTALAVGLAIVMGGSGKFGLGDDYDPNSAGPRAIAAILLGATLFLVTYNYAQKWSPTGDDDDEGERDA